MNQFTEKYKTLRNTSLLKIIDNPNDYQPLAVEAAEIELAGRLISEDEFASARAENAIEIKEKQAKNAKRTAFENKIKDISSSIIDTIHPIQQTTPSTNRIIAMLCIILGLMSVIEAFREFGFIKFMLFDARALGFIEGVFYLLLLLVLPVGAYLFWRRRKSGWVLFYIYFSYSAINEMVLFFLILKHLRMYPEPDNIFPAMSPVISLSTILFFGGCLWLICKNNIREIYAIDKRTMFIATGTGAVLTAVTIFVSMG